MKNQDPKPDDVHRILIVAPNPDLGRWLIRLIGKCAWAEPAGIFLDLQDVPLTTRLSRADTLLLDFQALSKVDWNPIPLIKAKNPDLSVILMDLDSSPAMIRLALKLGADALVSKGRVIEELRNRLEPEPNPFGKG